MMPPTDESNSPGPSSSKPESDRISSDPSLTSEPHLRQSEVPLGRPDPEVVPIESTTRPNGSYTVDHSVWDEPGLSIDLAGEIPRDATTYRRWLEERISRTSRARSWMVTICVVLMSGSLAVMGTFLNFTIPMIPAVAICIVGPVTEEIMKVALAIWIVERHPYLFRSATQIVICAIASGAAFAVVENMLYLSVYLHEPEPWLVQWRWSVCVALHIGCTLIASLGVKRIWTHTMETKSRPQLALGSTAIIVAIVIHGIYNLMSVVMTAAEFRF